MDNMLYIIAGLVLILSVAGFLWRKNKAQKPTTQLPVHPEKDATAPTSKVDYGTPAQNKTADDSKFDHVTIAQRFMEQQRYDKALETLKRGLADNPNDGQLSLKLLSLYATINQPEDFDKVYDKIKTLNDPKVNTRADELKQLYFEEQNPVIPEAPEKDTTDFESIDFDLPTNQGVDATVSSEQPTIEDNNDAVVDEPIDSLQFSDETNDVDLSTESAEDDFDLTLSDLESDINEPDVTSETPVTPLDHADEDVLETATADSTNAVEENDLSDFEFDFDALAEDTPTEDSVTTNHSSNENEAVILEDEAVILEDEDFTLDFDDLAADADKDTVATSDVTNDIEENANDTIQNSEDDFALSVDSLDDSNDIETASDSESPVLEDSGDIEDSNDIDSLVIEDSGFEIEESLESIDLEEQPLDHNDSEYVLTEGSSITPTALFPIDEFSDNTLTDGEVDTHVPTALTPVTPIEDESPLAAESTAETAEDFSSRFAADFDFVKSLDSNQVTLDLASQYLQLGEYDSAKRLLSEVITQGTSEQKSQAQTLLDRTA